MADWNLISQPESFGLQFERMAAQIRCAMPGIILEFDPALQTAAVQPALKMKVNLGDEQKHLDLPVVQNVPVVLPFAQGAGLLLTLPLGPGDECLLVFSDRALDNFLQNGGAQPVQQGRSGAADSPFTAPRAHSLTDAICIPGLISNPQAVPAYSQTAIELRDRARRVFLSLGPDGIVISDGSGSWSLCNGRLEINTPGGFSLTAPAGVSVTAPGSAFSGELTAAEYTLPDGRAFSKHVHTNVENGPNRSGGPVNG